MRRGPWRAHLNYSHFLSSWPVSFLPTDRWSKKSMKQLRHLRLVVDWTPQGMFNRICYGNCWNFRQLSIWLGRQDHRQVVNLSRQIIGDFFYRSRLLGADYFCVTLLCFWGSEAWPWLSIQSFHILATWFYISSTATSLGYVGSHFMTLSKVWWLMHSVRWVCGQNKLSKAWVRQAESDMYNLPVWISLSIHSRQ